MGIDAYKFVLELIIAIVTVVNAFISMRVKLDITNMKLWCMEKFITKDDHLQVLRAAISTAKDQ